MTMPSPVPTTPATTRHASLIKALDEISLDIGLFDSEYNIEKETRIRDLRRRGQSREKDKVTTLTLVEEDGVLYWRDRSMLELPSGRRGRGSGQLVNGEIVTQRRFEALEPDGVSALIQKLDDRFSPLRGLRKLLNGHWVPATGPFEGNTLLLLHGTFSNNDHFLDEFKATLHGQKFISRAEQHYKQVLAFDHSTLAVGPLLNALDLARLLVDSTHDVDVVAHSRGGLVTRWWLEALGTGSGRHARAVLVGSPLTGTSLAAGPRIRGGLDLLTNYGVMLERAMGLIGTANPFLYAPAALLRILLSVTGTAARIPIADAAVAMVPGLFSQARISNNSEILRLKSGPMIRPVDYFVVRSNFEPRNEGWKFWRYFCKTTVANSFAQLVFEGESDLVVDTESMSDFGSCGARLLKTWDFNTNPDVHHVNYFRQPETIAFIADSLEIPHENI